MGKVDLSALRTKGRTVKPQPRKRARFDLVCPECGARMDQRESRHGPFYGCSRYPRCKATHGAHRDGSPLGIPADGNTKEARIEAHEVFDALWKSGHMKRPQAYAWLAQSMGLPSDETHIGKFTEEQCGHVVALVEDYMEAMGWE